MPYLKELGRQNTLDLIKLIEWNAAHHIYFLRGSSHLFLRLGGRMTLWRAPVLGPDVLTHFRLAVSSELFPFAAHPDYQYSLDYAHEELTKAGETARRLGVRLTSHPGQFSQRELLFSFRLPRVDGRASLTDPLYPLPFSSRQPSPNRHREYVPGSRVPQRGL